MDKYTLLIVLNLPFVLFGYVKTALMLHTKTIRRFGFFIRISFWTIVLLGLVFNRQVYEYLAKEGLSDSTPLSIADVILVTGVILSIVLVMRAYSRVDYLEKRLTSLHEKLSISESLKK